ncbi:hypothetical protein BDV98DRAFT_603487 [Pterulicium gracile]|uniref:Protein kinase domain-containing protein n=1 Tax=Pterulicium gracile TaxID=1884261 RepID=A0A5C3QQV4_9AGAR|nr:hypothetical protein BDV98DRAFT_603487 [Pterula gracilis]
MSRAHRDLYKEASILHRDVSERNVMLDPTPRTSGSRVGLRQGILIDLDYAMKMGALELRRSGTVRFMAYELQLAGKPRGGPHSVLHDLQSLAWVIFCETSSGKPGKQYSKSRESLERWIDETFSPYFEPLRDLAHELRKEIIDKKAPSGHDGVLKITGSYAEKLPRKDDWSARNDPVGHGTKRPPKNDQQEREKKKSTTPRSYTLPVPKERGEQLFQSMFRDGQRFPDHLSAAPTPLACTSFIRSTWSQCQQPCFFVSDQSISRVEARARKTSTKRRRLRE